MEQNNPLFRDMRERGLLFEMAEHGQSIVLLTATAIHAIVRKNSLKSYFLGDAKCQKKFIDS